MEGQQKKVLVTGGTSGLGLCIVKMFLSDGYQVYATGRENRHLDNKVPGFCFVRVDFSVLKDVASVISGLAETAGSFDIIINNAGVLSPPEFTQTIDNIEYSFQVNFLSHLLINEILIRHNTAGNPLQIISVTSPVYKYVKPKYKIPESGDYKMFNAYSESKFYMLLIGGFLQARYPEKVSGIINYNPGTFRSGIYRMQKPWFRRMYRIAAPFMRSPEKVASRLYDILQTESVTRNAVYSQWGSYKIQNLQNSDRAAGFMRECMYYLEDYFAPSRL